MTMMIDPDRPDFPDEDAVFPACVSCNSHEWKLAETVVGNCTTVALYRCSCGEVGCLISASGETALEWAGGWEGL